MYINEQYKDLDIISSKTYQYIGRNGDLYQEEEPVLEEHLMDVYINGKLTMKLICLPENLTELILGRLLTEGIITSAGEVEAIYICEYGKRARVMLSDLTVRPSDKNYVETTPSCCTGNHILNDCFNSHQEVLPVTPIPWKADWVFALADRFSNGMPIHSQTWATHSCFLAKNETLLFQCEDIGRHNALDKVIGYALRHQIDLTQCIVYSSGRIPTDMVMKAIRAGIPILSSKASLTCEAVQLAEKYHLTLVCAARRDRMKLYTGQKPD